MGRNFDDEGDSDLSNANDLAHLSSEFDSATSVLASPAKCGMFIDYLFSHKRDPTWVLFYLVNQYFQRSMAASKELYKDEKRVCLEIFTTFLHEKSPLRLDIRTPISLKSFDFHECSKLFNTISQTCLNQIQTQVSKLAEAINLGMDTWCLSEPIDFLLFHNKEEEIACFESRLSGYLDSLYQLAIGNCTENSVAYSICRLPTTTSSSSSSLSVTSEQIAQAITSCLVTAHKYYSMPRLTSADYPETRDTGHSIRHSIFARSFENLTSSALGNAVGLGNVSGSIGTGLSSAGSNLWTKLTPYCAKAKQKSHSLLNRKTKWSHKGHSFYEYSYERIAECGVCGFLLWGLNLQGFNCNNCDLFVHLKCKNGIRDQCSREGRRTGGVSVNVLNGILGSIPNLTVDTNTSGNNMNQTNEAYNKLSLPIAHIGQNDVIYHTTSADHHPHEVMPATDDTANSSAHDSSNSGLMETSSVVTNNCCPGNASVGYLSPGLSQRDSFSSTLISSTSTSVGGNSAVQSPSESSGQTSGQFDKQRLSGEESGLSMNDPRHVKQMKSLYEGNDVVQETTPNPRSDSVASNAPSSSTLPLSSTLSFDRPFDMPPPPAVPPPLPPTSQPCTSSPISNVNETVRELVSTDWSDDPEMIASASFEAAVELRAQFPNFQMPSKGQKSEEYIRTLVLLEFHQKTQYMVRHLKQYEYLLLRRWPPEHTKVAKILCLDQIPILINLFRSLVTCIDQTKTDQGYCGMAEAVLAWLTDNSSANLKTWARHCQALSCSNMLDTVRHAVRDYVRRHPDIVPLLQTRHNKFVLIEGLKQMRILYFNLPLIANNIAKDLEKKTKMYKAEAKIWQQIQLKLASLPQTIDNVCMPLVKRINQGQLCTSLDKKDILSKPLPDLLLPFQHLLLNFPRVLFHHWVVAHAEVTVDKLTANRSNKVNHDYICERTDMLAILLHDALILLVKDSERYILRGFKAVREQGGCGGGGGSSSSSSNNNSNSSGAGVGSGAERASSFGSPSSLTEKDRMSLGNVSGHSSVSSTSSLSSAIPSAANVQSHTSLVSAAANAAVTSMTDRSSASGSSKLVPIFPLIDVFTSCGEKFGGDHLLNIVFMKQTVLIRLLFSKEDERQKWAAHIQENSVTTQSIDRQRVLKPTTPSASTQSQPSIDLPSESLIPKSSDITPVVNEATTVVTPQPSTEDLKTSFNMLSTAEPTSTELLANEDKSIIQLNGGKNSNGICSPEESTVFVDKLQTAMNGLLDQTQRVICEKYNISNEELLSVMRETDGNVEDISNPGKILLFQIKYFAKCFTLITRTLAPQTSSSLLDQIKNQIESVNNEDYQQFEALIRQKKRQSSLSWTEGYLDSLSRSPVLFNENNTVTSVLTSSSSASSSSSSKVPPAYYATDSQTDNPVVKVTTPSTHSSPNLFTSDNERNRIEVQDRRKSKRRSIKSETSPVLTSNFTFLDHLLDKELVTMAPLFAKSVMCLCKLTHQDFSYSSCLKQSVSQKTILSRSSVQIDSEMHWTESNTSGTGSTEDGEDEEVKTLANSIIDLSGSRPCDTMNYTLPSVEQSDTINTDFEFPTNEILESSENDIHEVARQIVSDALENAKNFISNMKPDGDEPKTLNVVRDSGCAPSATDDDEEEEEEEAEGDYNDNYRGNHHKIVEETSESHTVDNDEISTPVYFSSSEIMTPRSLSIPSHVLDDDPLDQTIISDNAPSLNDDLFITNGAIDAILQHQTVGSSPPPDSVASGTTNIGRNDSQKSTTSSGYVDSGDD
uniref:Phorbol-ester/DAG-type domain-containing protein n=1 Tax=Trichobilharzia regenti TaxID=157069 RepID=A0AA85JV28_TRIRE|nr:unnamed protein product [Trichobilharzia regenti]